jgi:predicted nucleic acid-binding protein
VADPSRLTSKVGLARRRSSRLVDGVVVAMAKRLGADGIATLDLRHFGAVAIRGEPLLLPRDL